MPSKYDRPARRGRYEKTHQRRQILLRILRQGQAVHGEKLRREIMPDRSQPTLSLFIRCMRADGYVIETLGVGLNSRGYRLISEPRTHNL